MAEVAAVIGRDWPTRTCRIASGAFSISCVAAEEAAGEDFLLVGKAAPELERVAPQHHEGLELRALPCGDRRMGRDRQGFLQHVLHVARQMAGARVRPGDRDGIERLVRHLAGVLPWEAFAGVGSGCQQAGRMSEAQVREAGFARHLGETVRIAAPIASALLAEMAMGLTDTVMLGSIGDAALAAGGLGAEHVLHLPMVLQGGAQRRRACWPRVACGAGRPGDMPADLLVRRVARGLLAVPAFSGS